MYCRLAEKYKINFEKDAIILSSRKILWPNKLLKIFRELENFGYDVKINDFSCKKKIKLKEFKRLLENQEYKEDYIIFEAKPKGIRRLFNRSLICGYASYAFLGMEILNKNSSEFTVRGKDSIKLLEILLEDV